MPDQYAGPLGGSSGLVSPMSAEQAGEAYDHLRSSIPNLRMDRETFVGELDAIVMGHRIMCASDMRKKTETHDRFIALQSRWRALREEFEWILKDDLLAFGLLCRTVRRADLDRWLLVLTEGDDHLARFKPAKDPAKDRADFERWLLTLTDGDDHLARFKAAKERINGSGKAGRRRDWMRKTLIATLAHLYEDATERRAPRRTSSGPFLRLVEDVLAIVEPSMTHRYVRDIVRRAFSGRM